MPLEAQSIDTKISPQTPTLWGDALKDRLSPLVEATTRPGQDSLIAARMESLGVSQLPKAPAPAPEFKPEAPNFAAESVHTDPWTLAPGNATTFSVTL